MNKKTTNRETWLNDMMELMRPRFVEQGLIFRKRIQLSTGFCKGKKALGQCFYHGPDDDSSSIVICQSQVDSMEVAETLCHELIHASLPKGVGHKKPFLDACDKMLIKRSKYTGKTPEFEEWVQPFIDKLGEYPHNPIPERPIEPNACKIIRAKCPICDLYVRMDAKFLVLEDYRRIECPCCEKGTYLLTKDESPEDVLKVWPIETDGS